MLLHIVDVHLFSLMDSILLGEYIILFIHSMTNEYLGDFLWAGMISAAKTSVLYVNICVRFYFEYIQEWNYHVLEFEYARFQ